MKSLIGEEQWKTRDYMEKTTERELTSAGNICNEIEYANEDRGNKKKVSLLLFSLARHIWGIRPSGLMIIRGNVCELRADIYESVLHLLLSGRSFECHHPNHNTLVGKGKCCSN